MTADLTTLAERLTVAKKAEDANQRATVQLNTDDPARDKFWRRIGKIVRNDVKHTR